MARQYIQRYRLNWEGSTESMHYRIELVHTRTGQKIVIEKPTMKEAERELESYGFEYAGYCK